MTDTPRTWLSSADEALALAEKARLAGDDVTAAAATVFAAQALQIHRILEAASKP